MVLERDDAFFINGETGKPLQKIQNTAGSLLNLVAGVVGVPRVSLTVIRRAAERIIQKNPAMKLKCKVLNNHSPKVGEDYYDQSGKCSRVEYVRLMETMESPSSKKNSENFRKDSNRENRKKRKAEEDAISRKENAEKYLKSLNDRKKKSFGLNLRCKVKPKDRPMLMKFVFENIFNGKVQKFPTGKEYKNHCNKINFTSFKISRLGKSCTTGV